MEPILYAVVGPAVAVLISLKSGQVLANKQDEKIVELEEKAKVLEEKIEAIDRAAAVYMAKTMQPMAIAIKECQTTLGIQ